MKESYSAILRRLDDLSMEMHKTGGVHTQKRSSLKTLQQSLAGKYGTKESDREFASRQDNILQKIAHLERELSRVKGG